MIFLSKLEKLREARLGGKDAAPDSPPLIPPAAHPVLDCMGALQKVVKGSFGYELDPDYKQLIANYVEQLRELPALMLDTCGVTKGFTWKVGDYCTICASTTVPVHLYLLCTCPVSTIRSSVEDHGLLTGAYNLCAPGGLAGRPQGGSGEVRGAGFRVRSPHLHGEGVAALQGAARKQEVGYH